MSHRLPQDAHTSQPWLIHEIAPDFTLEDVWRIRTPGAGPDDFAAAVGVLAASLDGADQGAAGRLTGLLFDVRWRLGEMLGWDRPGTGVGTWEPPVADRTGVPDRGSDDGEGDVLPSVFSPIYRTASELASELANATAHAVLHLGWVRGADGDHELRAAVLVRPRGRRGRMYLDAITPFRRLVVWPAILGAAERAWIEREPVTGGRLAVRHASHHLTSTPDYVDAYAIGTDVRASPRAWMRACFEEGVDRPGRDLVFGRLLGMHTEPDGAPGTIAGWRVVSETDDHLTMQASGARVSVDLVLEHVDGGVRLTTAVRYVTGRGRATWEPLSVVHRSKVAGVLRTGAAILRQRGSSRWPASWVAPGTAR